MSGACYQLAWNKLLLQAYLSFAWVYFGQELHFFHTKSSPNYSLFSIIFFHLWKGHKPSYTEYGYFKAKGNLDFSTMGILTCTACQYNEHIQEIWLKSSRFLKLGTVLSAKCARVFHGCDLASIFALPVLSWIRLQAQCSLNTYTQRCKFFFLTCSGH